MTESILTRLLPNNQDRRSYISEVGNFPLGRLVGMTSASFYEAALAHMELIYLGRSLTADERRALTEYLHRIW